MTSDIFLSSMERSMLERGFSKFNVREKNELIAVIANREGKMYSEITDDYLLSHHKQLKINIFSERCETAILEGFIAFNGHRYRTNRDDQINFLGRLEEMRLDPNIQEVMFKTRDAGYITHTPEEFKKIFLEGLRHKEALLYKYDTLKQQVLNATLEADIISAIWE
jgi:hypothetical protein